MKNLTRTFNALEIALGLSAIGVLLIPLFLADIRWPQQARDYLEIFGVKTSGAVNLVSAIYLGYRAFDTLGETIVLLVAVSGTVDMILLTGKDTETAETELSGTELHLIPRRGRTDLLEVVTGKIAPVVLLFGFYLMLFGHLSPGGGFQGGVVIASAIIFLAMGRRSAAQSRLTDESLLSRIEASAFLLFLAASLGGIILGDGFFFNPMVHFAVAPVGFIVLLNVIIGFKVGAGIGLMCITMLGKVKK